MKRVLLPLSVMFALSGCVIAPHSGSVYRAYDAQNEQTVRLGYVEAVREVRIDGGRSGVGTASGAALGAIAAGSGVGKGNGALAAGIAGAVVGGLIGQNVERNLNQQRGLEITVRLDNGELKAITQDADEVFQPNDRVRLLSNGRTTRVTH